MFAPSTFAMLGLPSEWYGAVEFQYPPHQRQGSYEEEGRAINTMKARCPMGKCFLDSLPSHILSKADIMCATVLMPGDLSAREGSASRLASQGRLLATACRTQGCHAPSQGGIVTADRLVTVSPGYAFEIQTPEGGWGLEGLLSSRSYALNGARALLVVMPAAFALSLCNLHRTRHPALSTRSRP